MCYGAVDECNRCVAALAVGGADAERNRRPSARQKREAAGRSSERGSAARGYRRQQTNAFTLPPSFHPACRCAHLAAFCSLGHGPDCRPKGAICATELKKYRPRHCQCLNIDLHACNSFLIDEPCYEFVTQSGSVCASVTSPHFHSCAANMSRSAVQHSAAGGRWLRTYR